MSMRISPLDSGEGALQVGRGDKSQSRTGDGNPQQLRFTLKLGPRRQLRKKKQSPAKVAARAATSHRRRVHHTR
jgi:hypothetical protein